MATGVWLISNGLLVMGTV